MRGLLRTFFRPGFSIPFFIAIALVFGGFPWPVRFQGHRMGLVLTQTCDEKRKVFGWSMEAGIMLPAPIQRLIAVTWNTRCCRRYGHRWVMDTADIPIEELECIDCGAPPTPEQLEEIRQARDQAVADRGGAWKAQTGY